MLRRRQIPTLQKRLRHDWLSEWCACQHTIKCTAKRHRLYTSLLFVVCICIYYAANTTNMPSGESLHVVTNLSHSRIEWKFAAAAMLSHADDSARKNRAKIPPPVCQRPRVRLSLARERFPVLFLRCNCLLQTVCPPQMG